MEKINAHELRDNLLSADVSAVSDVWSEWRKEFTVEQIQKLTEVCGD